VTERSFQSDWTVFSKWLNGLTLCSHRKLENSGPPPKLNSE